MAWAAEEAFNSYSNTTDINGGTGGTGWGANAWSRSGGAITSTTSSPMEGAAMATATSAGLGSNNYERQLGSDFSGYGTIYCALRRSSTSSGEVRWNFRNTTDSGRLSIVMNASGNIRLEGNLTQVTVLTGYSANTTYFFRIKVDTTTGVATCQYSTDSYGTAGKWSNESSQATFSTGAWRYVLIDFGAAAGTGVTNYWDYLSPTSPYTGIQYDASASATGGSGLTSLSASHFVCDEQNRGLFVSVFIDGGSTSEFITGITANGDAMTQLSKQQRSAPDTNSWSYVYYLANPDAGIYNVTVTTSASCYIDGMISASYTGVKQTGIPDASNTAANRNATASATITVVAANSWAMAYGYADNGDEGWTTWSPTNRKTNVSTFTQFADSNGVVSTGSYTAGETGTGNTAIHLFSVAPHVSVSPFKPRTSLFM